MLYKAKVAVCSYKYKTHKYSVGRMYSFLNVKPVVASSNQVGFKKVNTNLYEISNIFLICSSSMALRPVFGPWPPRSPSSSLLSSLLPPSSSVSAVNIWHLSKQQPPISNLYMNSGSILRISLVLFVLMT